MTTYFVSKLPAKLIVRHYFCENVPGYGNPKVNVLFQDRNNLRVQFGDISKNDITNKRLFLVRKLF
jgi:hypothetical protein